MAADRQQPDSLPPEPLSGGLSVTAVVVVFLLNAMILAYALHVALPAREDLAESVPAARVTRAADGDATGGSGMEPGLQRVVANVALPSQPETVSHFVQHCAACHGLDGRGRGPAAEQLYPQPRDFVESPFRFASTTGDRDEILAALERTITQGVPRSAMPGFGGVLTESQIAGLAHHVLDLRGPQDLMPAAGELHVDIGRHPPLTAALVERGRELYTSLGCVTCHGSSGHGDGPGSMGLFDSTNRPVRPGDLASGLFKSGQSSESIARTILAGVPGTPMTPFEAIVIRTSDRGSKDATDLWALVAYIRSFAPRLQPPGIASGAALPIAAAPDSAMLDDPSHIGWLGVRATSIGLRPLWQREEATTVVHVRVVQADDRLAIGLDWDDPLLDVVRDIATFPDGAAVMFALGSEVPALPMGVRIAEHEATEPVNIWHWQADRQYDAVGDRSSTAMVMQRDAGERWYVFRSGDGARVPKLTGGEPVLNYESVADEPRFDTAGAVGNVLAQVALVPHAALEANALGFGTLTLQPESDQGTFSTAAWSNGVWRVVLTRSLTTGSEHDIQFDVPRRIPMALAIWDGAKGDHAGVKLVSGWHWLVIEGPGRVASDRAMAEHDKESTR